jgi:cyclophilin family peptidyl-prolyl cis-trans isomerase
MSHKTIILILMLVSFIKTGISQSFAKETILISTIHGNIKIRLFNETPLHRDNFLKLVKEHFYDSLLFHRVIEEFMIQGGDPDSKLADGFKVLGDGDLNYTIPAEIKPELFHKKGMLCAARNGDDVNPTRASSACQFYIVQGKQRTEEDLKSFEKRINRVMINRLKDSVLNLPQNAMLKQKISTFKTEKNNDSLMAYTKQLSQQTDNLYEKMPHFVFSETHKTVYKSLGGTPHLDTNYTIFGEVTEGMEVIDRIAAAKTGKNDRPLIDIRMKISIVE